MKLSAEVFEQIMRHVRSDQPADGDHRFHPRVGLTATASIVLNAAPTREVAVRIRDVSRSGFGFLNHGPLRGGDRFLLKLPRHNAAPLTLDCEVINTRPVARGLWTVGATFTSPLRIRRAG
jgi:hypothetical protein